MFIKPKPISARHGFTLHEVMLALAISALLGMALVALLFFSHRSMVAAANYHELGSQSRRALDQISKEVRQCNRLVSWDAHELVFEDPDGLALAFEYDQGAETLDMTVDGTPIPLLDHCDFLEFSIFQRNPVGGAHDQFPTASADTCKVVSMTWRSFGTVLGVRSNTEHIQTAKVVIRRQ